MSEDQIDKALKEELRKKQPSQEPPFNVPDRTKKPEVSEQAATVIREIYNKLNRGPIHIEKSVINHPYNKDTLHTIYAESERQPTVETTVVIHQHVPREVEQQVRDYIIADGFKPEEKPDVIYEYTDRAGVCHSRESGQVNKMDFTNLDLNPGSITATLRGRVDWS